jgi:metal-responsive CopG/Arc/MetJ family transcriptional regulator
MKRGAVTKSKSRLVTVWIPSHIANSLDAAVRLEDSDRSKFIRRALRDKLHTLGIVTSEKEALL